eukprot:scaffold31561_cov153-Amphora_coffeaeformis.AAC.2
MIFSPMRFLEKGVKGRAATVSVMLALFFFGAASPGAAAQQPSSSLNPHHTNSSHPAVFYPLSQQQKDHFLEDGYVVVRGALDTEQLDALYMASQTLIARQKENKRSFFTILETGMIFDKPTRFTIEDHCSNSDSSKDSCLDETQIRRAFRQVALHSTLPSICAQLMQLDPATQNIRILRDVFLAKPIQDDSPLCDWHVDDQGFWPESYLSDATVQAEAAALSSSQQQQQQQQQPQQPQHPPDQYGINAWIALEDMPAAYGGSMLVAKGSHRAEWRHQAYQAIRQDRTVDKRVTRHEMLALIKAQNFSSTCDIGAHHPKLRETIEDSKVVLDLQKGDVILATRLLFHRTDAVTAAGVAHYVSQLGLPSLPRYSIRYVPGTARLPLLDTGDWSLISNPENAGKTLNAVVQEDGMWFPGVWPTLDSKVEEQMDILARDKIPAAIETAAIHRQEFIAGLVSSTAAASSSESATTTTTSEEESNCEEQ